MNYLFAPKSVKEAKCIYQEMVEALGSQPSIEMFDTMEAFSDRLGRFDNPEIVVLLAPSPRDLSRLIAIRDLLQDARIILLVRDSAQDTVNRAHLLRPRFLGSMPGDLGNVSAVLTKMIQTQENEIIHRADALKPP